MKVPATFSNFHSKCHPACLPLRSVAFLSSLVVVRAFHIEFHQVNNPHHIFLTMTKELPTHSKPPSQKARRKARARKREARATKRAERSEGTRMSFFSKPPHPFLEVLRQERIANKAQIEWEIANDDHYYPKYDKQYPDDIAKQNKKRENDGGQFPARPAKVAKFENKSTSLSAYAPGSAYAPLPGPAQSYADYAGGKSHIGGNHFPARPAQSYANYAAAEPHIDDSHFPARPTRVAKFEDKSTNASLPVPISAPVQSYAEYAAAERRALAQKQSKPREAILNPDRCFQVDELSSSTIIHEHASRTQTFESAPDTMFCEVWVQDQVAVGGKGLGRIAWAWYLGDGNPLNASGLIPNHIERKPAVSVPL